MRRKYNLFCDDLYKRTVGKAVEKFNVDNMPQEILEKVLVRLNPIREHLAVQFIQCYDNLEINSKYATKGEVLKELCGQLEISANKVMAFGDSDNDVSMLLYAGESYAMSNGEEAAIKAAKYMAKANSEDGVAEVIEKRVLQA